MVTSRPAIQTIGGITRRNGHALPGHVAFEVGDRTLTYRAYLERSLRLGSALHRARCRHQDRVAILSQNSLEQVEIQGACEVAGFICVGLNYRLAAPEILFQLQDSTPRICFFQADYAGLIAEIRDKVPSVLTWVVIGKGPDWAVDYESFVGTGDLDGAPFEAGEEDISYLIYTSGSTGRPKGCLLSQYNQTHMISLVSTDIAMGRPDRTVLVMPMFHVGAKTVQLATQWWGGTSLLLEKFDPNTWIRTVAEKKMTVGHLAPLMIQDVIQSPLLDELDLSSLRLILYSAAAMPVAVLRRGLEKLGRVFHHEYGLTEGGGLSLHRLEHNPDGNEKDLRRLRSIGIPFPGTEVRIADDDGNPLPDETPGELLLKGPCNTVGYWNNGAATNDTLRGGWLRTGDIAVRDEDGYFYIVDRKKDMIISGGENIYSREVEEALFQHPGVLEAAVIGVPDEKWGEAVRAIIVPKPGHTLTQEGIVEHCRTLLASYKKPRSVIITDAIPRLTSGKFDKVAMRKMFGAV